MTEGDICTLYRQAKDKKKQVMILHQLTTKPTMEIVQILLAHGADRSEFPARYRPELRTCEECGAEYTGFPRSHFCPRCQNERRGRKPGRPTKALPKIGPCVCPECGATYTGYINQSTRCPDCERANTRELHKKQCAICGAEIYGQRTYCPDCAKARQIELQRDRREKARKAKPPKLCAICGAEISHQRTYCPDCAKKKQRQGFLEWQKRKRQEHAGLHEGGVPG